MAFTLSELSCGATFYRADLHIHSYGASYDVTDKTATPENIVDAAAKENLHVIAITDHNNIDNVKAAVDAGKKRGVVVIPGVELSTPQGHLLCYAPTVEALQRFFHKLTIQDAGTKECRCQEGIVQCLDQIAAVGGFGIIAHIELKGAFEENVPRMTPSKLDIICHDALLAIEVSAASCSILYNDQDTSAERKSAARARNERRGLGTQQVLARVVNSDAHSLNAVGRNAATNRRVTRYKMEQPSFDGLRIALHEADTRVRIEEEIPLTLPKIKGVSFEGGFLSEQSIHFSPNLTCIIGGRGSGKSTTFSAIRLLGGKIGEDEQSVIDSDVWSEFVSLYYTDEADQEHILGRSSFGSLENLGDGECGPTSFALESYGQGETHTLVKKAQKDPLTLLTFLDRLIGVEPALHDEDLARTALNELIPKISKAEDVVAKIPQCKKDLALKQSQLTKLKKEKGEEVIALQEKLETDKRTRILINKELGKLNGAVSSGALSEVIEAIKSAVQVPGDTTADAEGVAIQTETTSFEADIGRMNGLFAKAATDYAARVKVQLTGWQRKDAALAATIETKKAELLSSGIRLDMPFIQKLAAEAATLVENLRVYKTWEPHLAELKKQYIEALKKRWVERQKVSEVRTAFGKRATAALGKSVTDIFVSLKYEPNCCSPDARDLIVSTMGWRTLQHIKAGALVTDLTIPVLLQCIKNNDPKPILTLKYDNGAPLFTETDAYSLLERLSQTDVKTQLETVAIHDTPKLTVTKKIVNEGKEEYFPRDFAKLSLGQQHSVLLALMLVSESTAPLIIDQPEDNLDGEFIYKTLVPAIRRAKERRQVVIVTHNANIAILSDPEQIVVLKATNDKAKIMARGSIDDPQTREHACLILEGAREAFDRRARIYNGGSAVLMRDPRTTRKQITEAAEKAEKVLG